MRTIWHPATLKQALEILKARSIPVMPDDATYLEFYDTPTPGHGWQKEVSLALVWSGETATHRKTADRLEDDILWDVCIFDEKEPDAFRNTRPRIYKTGSGELRAAGIVYTKPIQEASFLIPLRIMQIQTLLRARTPIYVYPAMWPHHQPVGG